MSYYVYILQCADNSYYVGSTSDLGKRIQKHNAGKGSSWTAKRLPVKLVYSEKAELNNQAIKREKQLKGWARAKKEALIMGDLDLLKELSKSNINRNYYE